ncbi:MAG: hypothetical protein V1902_00105 [Candidatus Falkowbacteria bacterium]
MRRVMKWEIPAYGALLLITLALIAWTYLPKSTDAKPYPINDSAVKAEEHVRSPFAFSESLYEALKENDALREELEVYKALEAEWAAQVLTQLPCPTCPGHVEILSSATPQWSMPLELLALYYSGANGGGGVSVK